MLNLCLDANVYLYFYNYTVSDLKNLEKMLEFIDTGNLNLILTKQIVNEYNRNREKVLYETLNSTINSKLEFNAPKILDYYQDYKEIKSLLKKASIQKVELLKKMSDDILKRNFHADILIDKLFKKANHIDYRDTDIEFARQRSELGDPPGKKGSIGDAVNWVLLLENIEQGKDLYLVSEDGDFASKIDRNSLSDFLNSEWEEKKKSKVFFYNSFIEFVKEEFKTIELKNEQEIQILIEKLENSLSFNSSRSILAQILQLNNLSENQLNRVLEASYINNQIYMANDYSPSQIVDVLKKLIEGKECKLDQVIYMKFCYRYGVTPIIDEENLPF
jgi:hypothetical protein